MRRLVAFSIFVALVVVAATLPRFGQTDDTALAGVEPTPTSTPLPFPDLVLLSITDRQTGFSCPTPAGLRIVVGNQSSFPAPSSVLLVSALGGGASENVAVPAIGGNGTVTVFSSVTGIPIGDTYLAEADAPHFIAETNEGNNTLSASMSMGTLPTCTPTSTPTPGGPTATPTPSTTSTPALPDLVVIGISDRQQIGTGCTTPAGLRIVVRNQKPGSAGPSTLFVSGSGSGQSESVSVPSVFGNSTTIVYSSVVGIPSNDTYTATADNTGAVAEANESNNVTAVTMSLSSAATCTPSPTPGAGTPTVTPTPTGFSFQDTDGDGVLGYVDNCPFLYNPGQINSDRNFVDNHPVYVVDDKTLINSDTSGDVCDYDWDNDGLADGDEVSGSACFSATGMTNPESIDSDHDGFKDGYECGFGTDPINPASKPAPPAPGTDPDTDGVSTSQENDWGTNPNLADTDGDGLQDGWEVRGYASSPLSIDSDGDGIRDGCEAASINGDTIVNVGDQAMLAAEIMRAVPLSQKLANFDLNKDGVINVGDQAFQASRIGPGKCP